MFMMIPENVQEKMTMPTGLCNSTAGAMDENMARRFTSMSPMCLSAAVNSAFNLFKQKQLGQSHKFNNSKEELNEQFRDISNDYRDESLYEHEPEDNNGYFNKMNQFYQNQQLPILKCKYFESPINQSQIQYECTAPIARNTPENNEVKLIDYRQSKVASFTVDGKELICLPQAFELFLKNLVGGLHTVYTKLKRLDIVPIVCNVEQVSKYVFKSNHQSMAIVFIEVFIVRYVC